jgi:hypothetical protein
LGKERGLGKVVALSGIAAAASFILLYLLVPGLDMGTVLFVSLGLASSVGAIVAMDKGEDIGEVVGFAVLLLILFFGGWLLPSRTAVVFALPNNQLVVLDVWTLPLVFLGLVALFGIVKYLGGDLARFGLWIIVVALTLAYYQVADVTARILIAAMQAMILFIPVTREETKVLGLHAAAAIPALAAYDRVLTIDLTQVNVYAALLVPVLAFIALDPFRKIPSNYRALAAIVVLMLVFLQVISLAMAV